MKIDPYKNARIKVKIRKYYYLLSIKLARIGVVMHRYPAVWNMRKRYGMAVGSAFVAIVLLLVWIMAPATKAITKTLTPNDLVTGTGAFNQVQLGSNNASISLQRGDIGQWHDGDDTQLLPTKVYGDTELTYGPNNKLYFMTYISGCRLWTFDTEPQVWRELEPPPVGCGAGTQLVYDGGNLMYYLPGGDSTAFFSYAIDTGTWTQLHDTDMSVGTGASLVFVSSGATSALYLMRGASSASFWRYNVGSDSWESRASFPATTSINWGVNMVWDHSNYIYALANDRNLFKRYSIATDSWVDMTAPQNTGTMKNKMVWIDGSIYDVQLHVWNSPPESSFLTRYTPATDSWTSLDQPPAGEYRDFPPAATYDGGDYLYTMFGAYERPVLYKYKLSEQKWLTNSLFKLQDATFAHWDMIYDGNQYAYYLGGSGWGSMDKLYRLNLTNNNLEQIAGQTLGSTGVTGVYYNNALYLMNWNGGKGFRKYDIASNSWTWLQDAPANTDYGSSIIDGGDGYLYATFGSSRYFYRYSESGGWVRLADLNQTIYNDGGITRIGRTIYALIGNGTSYLLKYNMDTNAWSYAEETPVASVSYGDFFTGDSSRYLYAGLGPRAEPQNRTMYQYDTTTSTWKRMADLPQSTQVGASAFYSTATSRLYVSQGAYQSSLWYWNSTATAYVTTGNWYSKTLDLKHVANWSSFNATVNGTGTATFYTRTSDHGGLWTDWQAVSGTSIQSPKKRYLQIKLSLSGSGSATPVASNISLTYTQDTTPPNLPSQFTAKGTSSGETLVSGQTYAYQHPYFSWGGAADNTGGSGVAGYYVYFGTDSEADPTVDGNYQTTANYTVTTAMTAGSVYYLRLAVKDNMGNTSDAATYFSYRYWYISPPASVLVDSHDDFAAGTNTGVNIDSGGSMSLIKQNLGAWTTGNMKTMPNSTYGPAAVVVGDFMYVLRGSGTTDFWRYDIPQQNWDTRASLPDTATIGSAITWDGGNYLYAIRGSTSNSFYRYDIQNDTWTDMPQLPAFAQAGTDIKYIGNNQIAIFFSGVSEFYFYHIDSGTFESRTPSDTITNSNAGGGIWYDGDDRLYVYHGGYDMWQPNRDSMQVYVISQDVWRKLAKPPFDAYYAENNLAGDGHGNLYVFANDYVQNQSHNSMAMKYNIASDTWKVMRNASEIDVRGTITSDGDRYIYEIPGIANTRRIVQYDTWDDRFVPQESFGIPSWQRLPWDDQNAWYWRPGNASSAAYDGVDNIYAIGAGEGVWGRFIRYSVSTGDTAYLSAPPQMGYGGSLAYTNGILYYLPARSSTEFYRYDVNTDSWVHLADVPASVYRPGANSLTAVGNELYALIGNGRRMYKFTPNGGNGTWTRMADTPGNIYMGAMTYDGSNYLYVAAGNGSTSLYRYSISGDSWSSMAAMPIGMSSYGGALMYKDGKIYTARGGWTNTMSVYDVSGNSWQSGPNTPEPFRYGAIFVPINDDYAYAIAGDDDPDLWRFNFPGTNAAYSGIATHISQPITVDGIFDYAGIKAQVTVPDDTKIEFFTRTSADGTNWSDWQITDQVKYYQGSMTAHVTSPPQKYTQIKAIMYSFNNQSTPVIDNYALDYYFDINPPTNPTLFNAYTDNTKTTEFSDNVWYNDETPYFDWPDPGEVGGATDGPLGSNIKGYWVYAGTDPTAQPQTAGVFVSSSEYAPTLTTAGTYYVRLQAVDITGNVDPNIFAPFIYKFDNVPPTNPSLITVTPSGFTSTNKYTFQWPNAFDANSGIDKYCYHTGALSGPFAAETCQDGLDLTDVATAYRPGTNVFYLRTKDKAGNYSTSYTTVSYYYSTDPPSPVTNLRAVPPVSTANLFAFTWDYPALFSGDPEQLTYCYSVNELPSPTNTTCTQDKYIAAFKAATQQGTNILYMVAKDEANNVNWNNYASANFIANTVSPGIPLNLVVTDTSDRLSNRWALTLTWDKPTFEGNGIASYVIERSIDNHTYDEIGKVSNTAYVDLTVEPGTVYYYRVRAADNVDNRGGASGVVAQSAKGDFTTPPSIVSDPRALPSFDQATMSWVTDRASTSFVYYGTNPTQLTQSKGSLDNVTEHSTTITGLQPSTNYYYKVQSFDNDRSYDLTDAYSQLYTFRTSANARIFDVRSADTTLNSSILTWQTSVPTKARIQYGTSTDYGFTQEDTAGLATSHIFKLSDLASGTTYHYRIVTTTEYGSVVTSDDYTLSTISRPIISNIRFQPLPDELSISVKITWNTNVPTSSDITYRGLGTQQKESDSDLVTEHEMVLRDLAGNTDYEFDIQGRDQYGNLASSERQTWHSGVDTRPPTISDMSVNVTTMDALGGSKAQLIVSWKTDEPSTTQIQYDKGNASKLSKKTAFDPEPTVSHVVVISNLDLAEVYRIQPISRDISGNTSYGVQLATVTPDKQQSPLDAVLNTLQRIFRF